MKRRLCLLLSILLVLTFMLPLQSYAQYDKELEGAIKKAKALFSITEEYDKFSCNINKYNDVTEYYLSWNDSTGKLGNISVTIDADSMVRNYYSYKPSTDKYEPKLPKVSKSDGLKAANDFIKKVAPNIAENIKYQEDNAPLNVNDRSYYYNFIRIENGVPFYNNSVYVSVNNITGEVQNFRCDWNKNLVFPDKNGILSVDEAQQAFIDKLGLDLVYKLDYNADETKAYLVYTTVKSNKAIDAKTGEVVDIYDYYYGMENEKAIENDRDGNTSGLTPEELDAVKNAKDIISEAEAEKVARDFLDIPKEYKLNNINLYNDWRDKDSFIWNAYFSEENKESLGSISINLDAKTKEIKSFNKYSPYLDDKEVKYDKEQVLQIANDYIKSIQKDRYSQVEYLDIEESIRPMDSEEKPRQYYFNFVRKFNDAYFMENGFNIGVDAVTGEITQYNFTWYQGDLLAIDNVISVDMAHDILFNDIGYELQYISQNNNNYMDENNNNQEVKLIYTAKKDKPLNIDAFSGELLYDYGKPYKEETISKYNDINDSYAKVQIEILAEYGISLPGNEFEPKQTITQKDFIYLLAKAKNHYFDAYAKDGNQIDKLYNYMINQGIIKEEEKAPESAVAKQDAVKFIIRALGYDKVADIEDIYKVEFNDTEQISPELLGYVAIAEGLGIVNGSGGSFNPTTSLTREQSAMIIYNLLNIN